ncbi:hypothetical protein CYFUS_008417 [Cystobacter fuscus]|uniref:Uncharacterized protein n=1 Tax=Cystobacter fuscus TaxID=43 RepID=A0A250JH63_9BACT|nr:hypothetical protein CYFUS_008417 [Cystobacter fuscus]
MEVIHLRHALSLVRHVLAIPIHEQDALEVLGQDMRRRQPRDTTANHYRSRHDKGSWDSFVCIQPRRQRHHPGGGERTPHPGPPSYLGAMDTMRPSRQIFWSSE